MPFPPRLIGKLPHILPPPMTSSTPGTWAYDTMSNRIIQDIYSRLIEDNSDELTRPTSPLRSECFLMLNDLKSSVLSGKTGYLRNIIDNGPDIDIWDKLLPSLPDDQRNWLKAPWLISEYYFYRRIVEAFRYFDTGYDMFIRQKIAGLQSSLSSITDISQRLPVLLEGERDVALRTLILTSLWGNRADLSLWPTPTTINNNSADSGEVLTSTKADTDTATDTPNSTNMNSYILDNHIEDVIRYINQLTQSSDSKRAVGIIVDNAGYEVVTDMFLGFGMIKLGLTDKVVFHTKGHPTFVSDATTNDCLETLNYLFQEDNVYLANWANEMLIYVNEGKILFKQDLFWCQPIPFWSMPESIENELREHDLVFVKGDANYRRLLGEREWPLDTSSKQVLSYMPIPTCALRTCKAEIGCGISLEKQSFAYQRDSKWLVTGKWGVIQFSV